MKRWTLGPYGAEVAGFDPRSIDTRVCEFCSQPRKGEREAGFEVCRRCRERIQIAVQIARREERVMTLIDRLVLVLAGMAIGYGVAASVVILSG